MRGGWGRVERPDAEIWFHDSGGTPPAVVLLHGLAGHALEWRRTIGALQPHVGVISVEQRGHGGSTRRPDDVSRDAFVADVLAVLDEIRVDRVTLVGQSMGGHTAMLVAAAQPDRVARLVLVESGLGGDGPDNTRAVGDWLRSWPAPFADRDEFIRFFGGAASVGSVWAESLEWGPDGGRPQWDADVLEAALAPIHEHEWVEEWGHVLAPTLLVRGEHGSLPARQVEMMASVHPHLETVTIEGAGHDLHLEQPEAWLRVLGRFLQVEL